MAVGQVSSLTGDNWQLINTTTLSGTTSSVTISSIAGYKKLRLHVIALNVATTGGIRYFRLNADNTYVNYVGGAQGPNVTYSRGGAGMIPLSVDSNQNLVYTYVDIDNADQSTPKTYSGIISNFDNDFMAPVQGLYAGGAITSITITDSNGNNMSSGTVKLYGIAS